MFSKLLVKLIDQAIVPAIVLLSTRILSIIGISVYLGITYEINQAGFTFSNPNDYVLVNTYSTFFMLLILVIGLFYILVKALVLHDSHIAPHLSAKLANLRLSSFIQASFDLYSQGSIWLSYTFLLTAVTGVLALFGLVFSWVFYVGLALSLLAAFFLVLDVENEIVIKKKDNTDFDTDQVYLEEKSETYS
jgi:hypothetical protein